MRVATYSTSSASASNIPSTHAFACQLTERARRAMRDTHGAMWCGGSRVDATCIRNSYTVCLYARNSRKVLTHSVAAARSGAFVRRSIVLTWAFSRGIVDDRRDWYERSR